MVAHACEMTPFVTDIEVQSELSTCMNVIMHNLLINSRCKLDVTMMNTLQTVEQTHNSREAKRSIVVVVVVVVVAV